MRVGEPLAAAAVALLVLAPDGPAGADAQSGSSFSVDAADIPAVPVPDAALVRPAAIRIDEIRIEGSSVLDSRELAAYTNAYEGRLVSLEELHELRHALSAVYVERGYVNSGVLIPDQQVVNGSVTLRAIEGELTDVVVVGNHRLRDRALAKRVERYVRSPLDIADLQTSLRILQEEPLVERVNAELLPGDALGESYLRLAVTERPPFELAVIAANDRSPSVGEDRGTLALTWHGLVGNGDVLSGRFGFTEGVEDNVLAYDVPLTAGGTRLAVLLAEQQADIVEEPFDDIDISSELTTWSLIASHPFVHDTDRSLRALFGFEHKRSESTLLDMPFSFSPGDVDGRATGSAALIGAEWARRGPVYAWAARGTLYVGVDVLDATINESGPDSRFSAFLGQLQLLRRIAWRGSELLVRAVIQDAHDPLLAMYKLPLGGRFSVRGYPENLFVRDNGVTVSIEYRFPLLVDAAGRPRAGLHLAAFSDYGVSWDEDDALVTARKQRIASVGLGLIWDPLPSFHAELYWGHDLDDVADLEGPDETLQEKGFHYGLSFAKRF